MRDELPIVVVDMTAHFLDDSFHKTAWHLVAGAPDVGT
jgi:hypothetical protein